MQKKGILSVIVILVCLIIFTGCDNKSNEEAQKWKTEYDKLYVINQNLEGQLEAQKEMLEELKQRIQRDQETIKELQEELKNK